MSWGGLRVPAMMLGLSLAAGCGGSSNSGGGTGGGGGGGNSTTVTFTVRGAMPTAVAAKIGSGAFTAQTLTSGALTLSIPSGTTDFAIAYVCPPWPVFAGGVQIGQVTDQLVSQENLAEGTSFYGSCQPTTPSSPQTGTLTGSVDATALAGVSYLSIEAGTGNSMLATRIGAPKSDFSFAAPAGNDRVEVLAFTEGPPEKLPISTSLLAAKTFDGQQVPGALNGGNPVVFNAADLTTPQPITYQGVPSGYGPATTNVFYNMAGQAAFIVALGAASTYPNLPAAAARSGDSYGFIATGYQNGIPGVLVGPAVLVQTTGSTGGPVTFSFPAPWSYSGPSAAVLPTFDFTYAGFTGKSGVHRTAILAWPAGSGFANGYTYSVSSSDKYEGGSTAIAFPDLSSVGGFVAGPTSGTQVTWLAIISEFDTSSGTHTAAESSGEYSVP